MTGWMLFLQMIFQRSCWKPTAGEHIEPVFLHSHNHVRWWSGEVSDQGRIRQNVGHISMGIESSRKERVNILGSWSLSIFQTTLDWIEFVWKSTATASRPLEDILHRDVSVAQLKIINGNFAHILCDGLQIWLDEVDWCAMGLLPDTQSCRLRMHRECWERFPAMDFKGNW